MQSQLCVADVVEPSLTLVSMFPLKKFSTYCDEMGGKGLTPTPTVRLCFQSNTILR